MTECAHNAQNALLNEVVNIGMLDLGIVSAYEPDN